MITLPNLILSHNLASAKTGKFQKEKYGRKDKKYSTQQTRQSAAEKRVFRRLLSSVGNWQFLFALPFFSMRNRPFHNWLYIQPHICKFRFESLQPKIIQPSHLRISKLLPCFYFVVAPSYRVGFLNSLQNFENDVSNSPLRNRQVDHTVLEYKLENIADAGTVDETTTPAVYFLLKKLIIEGWLPPFLVFFLFFGSEGPVDFFRFNFPSSGLTTGLVV